MRLVDRDINIFSTLQKFSFLTSKHINQIYFNNQRACDRRLKILYENKYLKKQRILVGYPYLFSLNKDSYKILGIKAREPKIRVDKIGHDIFVLDTIIYLIKKHNISIDEIITERQLHSIDGFSVRKHHPDFVFNLDENKIAVEIELTLKAKDRFLKNIEDNFLNYDRQLWIIPKTEYQIKHILNEEKNKYTNIFLKFLEEVQEYVRNT